MKTYQPKKEDLENKKWYVVDAEGKILGRLAAQIATVLRGKNKPTFTPHLDTGDFVIVTNAAKIAVTGRKMTDKMYYTHSGYPGGLHQANLQSMLLKHPEKVITLAVEGMLPHNRLGRVLLGKLKVYAGPNHPHWAQQPIPLPEAGPNGGNQRA